MASAVEERQNHDRPVLAQETIRKVSAQKRKQVRRSDELVKDRGRQILPHQKVLGHEDHEDASHPVVTEAFGGFVSDDVLDLWRESHACSGGSICHGPPCLTFISL